MSVTQALAVFNERALINMRYANAVLKVVVPDWVSAATYTLGTPVRDPSSGLWYTSLTSHSGQTTSPSQDPVNWSELDLTLHFAEMFGAVFTAPDAASEPVVIKGFAGQTADLLRIEDDTGTVLARVTKDGWLAVGADLVPTAALHGRHASPTAALLNLKSEASDYTGAHFQIFQERAANGQSRFIQCSSSSAADVEFRVRSDGVVTADGTFTGGGADRAEALEWHDGNPAAEDRIGWSVALESGKIRRAISGDTPIGVISGTYDTIGNAAPTRWHGKNLRDEWGRLILTGDGEKQIAPGFDETLVYVPRLERPEWDAVGVLGIVRMHTGEITDPRWIKVRDVSAGIEEWLIR